MNCAFEKEKLSAYYDGELAAGEKAEVERHIASCSECLRDLGELKSAALLIKELPRLRAPKSITEGVSREIQAAGKVHVMARFRRGVLWASAVAAGLFIVANAMFLSGERSAPAQMASKPTSMAPSLARSEEAAVPPPARKTAPKDEVAEELDRARRQDEPKKRAMELDAKQEAARPADPLAEAGKKSNANEAEKVIVGKEVLAKGDQKTAAPASAPAPTVAPPPAAMPEKPTAAPAPVAKAEVKVPAEQLAEKSAERKLDAAVPKPENEPKAKAASAGPAPAELPPLQYSCVTTQLAKARPRLDESLKKLGVVPLPPPAQPMKAPRNREAENTVVVELTDAQLIRLREELEKPGDVRLVAGSSNTVEPVLPGFRSGGLYGNKAVAGGAGPKAPAAAPKDKDGKELEDKPAADAAAAPEPRRKVTLHLVEAKSLPSPEAEAVPAKKN